MLLEEPLDGLHVQTVVLVRVPLEGRREEVLVAEPHFARILLVLLVAVRETRQLASLPGVVAHEEGLVKRPEEDEAVENDGPLVGVPEHYWVLRLHHLLLSI